MIGTSPDRELIASFRDGAGTDARAYAEVTVCYDEDAERGLKTVLERWPNAALPGALNTELPLPEHFEQAAGLVKLDDLRQTVVTGAEPAPYIDAAHTYAEAGYDGVWFHQVGIDQEGFTSFARKELLPQLR